MYKRAFRNIGAAFEHNLAQTRLYHNFEGMFGAIL